MVIISKHPSNLFPQSSIHMLTHTIASHIMYTIGHSLSIHISLGPLLTHDGTDEPHQAVELVWKAHLQQHGSDVGRFHGVAELDAKQDAAIEEQLG